MPRRLRLKKSDLPWLTKKPRQSPEHDCQVKIAELLAKHAADGVIWYAVPNGGLRNINTAKKLKAEGVRAGVADHALIINGQPAFLELKAKNGVLSDDQKKFRDDCLTCGALWAVAKSYEQARDVLFSWGAIKAGAMLDYYS